MSQSKSSPSKADIVAEVQALIAGTGKHFANATVAFGNTTFTAASLVQLLQSLVTAITDANAAQLAATDAVATKSVVMAKVIPVVQGYRRFIRATFASASQTLADFGLEPPKARAPLSVEEKAAAAAKMRATRAARGTASKKQKLAISGKVTGVSITPITEPASPTEQTVSTASSTPAPAGPVTK